MRQAESAVFLRNLDAERAHVAQLLHDRLGDLAGAVDLLGIDALHEATQAVQERFGARLLVGVRRRMRVDQIETESSEEELAHEARVRPLGLARGLRNVSRFLLARRSNRCVAHVRLRKITSPIIEIAANENHWIA